MSAAGPPTSRAFHRLQLGASRATTAESGTIGDKAQTQGQQALCRKHDWGEDEADNTHCVV